MPDSSQEQQFGNVDLTNSKLVSVNAGGDAIVDSPGAQIIRQSYWSLFGDRASFPGIDWDWAMQILKQQQPDIKKRLKESLFGLAEVDAVEMESKNQEESLALEAKKTLTVNGNDTGTSIHMPIIATYAREDIAGSLLILGTPGSGKTITLLKLAEQLVGEAIANPQTVIPVIFELSTWRDGQEIEAWLIEQLYENYGGKRKRKIYETWLGHQVLLPLLDGLDELGIERQKACTEKVNAFAATYPQVVVCCRVKEFQQAGVNLSNVRGNVQLQPLSDRQIERYLQQMEKIGLWEQIQSVPEMRWLLEPVINPENADNDEPGLLRVPLFISLAAQVYEQHKPLKGKADLFDRYINGQLSWDVREGDRRKDLVRRKWAFKTVKAETGWRETRHSLSWVARQLQQRNQVELLIEKIQPSWLEGDRSKFYYRLIASLIAVLMFGLGGPMFGLTGGLMFGLIGTHDDIKPVEDFRKILMSRKMLRDVLSECFQGLTEGLRLGLTGGLMVGILYGVFLSLIVLIFSGTISEVLIAGLVGVMGGLAQGLIVGLVIGLAGGVIRGFKQDLKIRSKPNQGIWNSLQSAVFTTIFSFLGGIIVVGFPILIGSGIQNQKSWAAIGVLPWSSVPALIVLGLWTALFCGICYGGGLAVMQHLYLRLFLTHHHKIPWNLARFLTYCHERRLLQQIGGRYRFIHRELLEHFARMEN